MAQTPTPKQLSELEQLKSAYSRFADTRDGKLILADLERRFYDSPMKGDDLNREVGRRDVVLHIKQMVKQNAL